MWSMIWPILMVLTANTFYNICTKSMPGGLNAFASLFVSYGIAAVLCLAAFFITGEQKNLALELSKMNWTSIVLGFAIVALEFGWIVAYRAGWKVSMGSVVANVALACVLLIVGLLLYKEVISLRQLIGLGVCIVGIILITK